MREKWPYYRRKIYFGLLILSFILGVHGLYVYYRPILTKDWQLISAMFYGTMKLYLFAPPLAATAEVSLSYEIAKWLAPLLTSALVLTALTNKLRHGINVLSNLFGKRIVVFGYGEESRAFFESLHKEKNPYKKILVSSMSLDDVRRKELEKSGVAVYFEDVMTQSRKELEAFAKQIHLNKCEHLLFFDVDETVNYQRFMALLPVLSPRQRVKVHLNIKSQVLSKYVQQALERKKIDEEAFHYIDLHVFHLSSLSVELLLSQGRSVHFLSRQLESLKDSEDFMEDLPPVHIFILGMNTTSKVFIQRSINDFVIRRGKIQFSIMDPQAEEKVQDFLYKNPALHNAIEVTTYNTQPGLRGYREAIDKIRRDVTAVFLNHRDPLVNLEAVSSFDEDLPIAFRNEQELNLRELLLSHKGIVFYGNLSKTLTSNIVLQESLDKAAIAFNKRYDEVSSVVGSGGSPWEKLSPTKKNSSRLSAAHSFVKEAILLYETGKTKEELREELAKQEEEFSTLVQEKQGEDFRLGLESYFDKYPHLQKLSELEHLRWCYSYYSMGYRQGSEKDERRKTHPCLIESWDFLMKEGFFSCHPEYDLISALSLFGGFSETK